MTYYAVIDTNILVSALLSSHENAATVQVVSRLFSNDGILAEYNEVLRRKNFTFLKMSFVLYSIPSHPSEKISLLLHPVKFFQT